jgi:tetratricopeptide (TPR) repeat protein
LDERQVSRYVAFRIVRDQAMRTGDYDEVYSLYQTFCPELLQPDPQIDSNNNYYVGGLAPLLAAKGDVDKAQQLLELAIERIKRRDPDLTSWYSRIAVAKRLALKGDTREALDMLRRYVDRGERGYWWFFLEVDPALADFRAEPEYQAMVAEIRDGLAVQLALVREMEANGEIPIL